MDTEWERKRDCNGKNSESSENKNEKQEKEWERTNRGENRDNLKEKNSRKDKIKRKGIKSRVKKKKRQRQKKEGGKNKTKDKVVQWERAVEDWADSTAWVLLSNYLIVNNRPQRCERPFIRADRVINPCWALGVCVCVWVKESKRGKKRRVFIFLSCLYLTTLQVLIG